MTRRVHNNIAKLRKDQDWSQDTLAGRMNMSVTQLSRLERGASSLTQDRITAFAQVFDVEPYELFRDAVSKEKIELELMRSVIIQLDEMLLRLDVSLSPQQRGDLTIELYRLETHDLGESDLAEHSVDLKRYEGMVKALR